MIQSISRKIYSYIQAEGIYKLPFMVLHRLWNSRKKMSYKHLSGEGIEIGAFGNPLIVDASRVRVKYVDYLPPEELKKINHGIAGESPVRIDYCLKADNLHEIADSSQDFVIANHVFEHLRDPIGTLIEWDRVLRPGGILFLTVPDKRRTFDSFRNRTTLDHMISDYRDPSDERDWQHYLEFARITLGERGDPDGGDITEEANILKDTNYSIHYHVFEEQDVLDIFLWGLENSVFGFTLKDSKHTSVWNTADIEFILVFQKS